MYDFRKVVKAKFIMDLTWKKMLSIKDENFRNSIQIDFELFCINVVFKLVGQLMFNKTVKTLFNLNFLRPHDQILLIIFNYEDL